MASSRVIHNNTKETPMRTVYHNGRSYTGDFPEEWLAWERMVDKCDVAMMASMNLTREEYDAWKEEREKDFVRNRPRPMIFVGVIDGKAHYVPEGRNV